MRRLSFIGIILNLFQKLIFLELSCPMSIINLFSAQGQSYSPNGQMQVSETTNVRGIYSTSESIVHFVLGEITKVDSIQVIWPNSKSTVKYDIASNQTIKLQNSISKVLDAINWNAIPESNFEEITASFGIDMPTLKMSSMILSNKFNAP